MHDRLRTSAREAEGRAADGLAEKPKGFQVIPRRWVVERTFA